MTTIYSYPSSGWRTLTPVGATITAPTGVNLRIGGFARFSYQKAKPTNGLRHVPLSGYQNTLAAIVQGALSQLPQHKTSGSLIYVNPMPITVSDGYGSSRFSVFSESRNAVFRLANGTMIPTGDFVKLGYSANNGDTASTARWVTWGGGKAVSYTRRLPWGRFVRTAPPPNPDPDPDPDPDPEIQNSIPYRKAYVVVNEVALFLEADNTPLPCRDVSVNLDYQSSIGSMSCVVPKSVFDVLEQNNEVVLHVNGNQLRFIVMRKAESRKFPGVEFSITAYTRNVLLGKEFNPEKKHASLVDCTSQQLVDLALNLTGFDTVFEGFDPWQLTPNKANAYGTPLDVAKFVADGFGGYVSPHLTQDKLRFLPAYPVAPWVIGDSHVDIDVPMACVTQYSSEDNVSPPVTAVYVSDGGSFMARVVKQGTTGESVGKSVVHSLACRDAPAAAIGLANIAASGKMEVIGVTMPVFTGVPLAQPGKIIKLTSRNALGTVTGVAYAIVRKMTLSATIPTVRQNLTLEVLKRA